MPALQKSAEPRPLRLLLVVDSLGVGGTERHVVDLAISLSREGYAVTVACSVAGPFAESLAASGIPVEALVGRLVKRRVSPTYVRRLARLMRSERYDLVHAHIYASAAAAAVATLGTHVPLVVTEHTEGVWQDRRARLVSRSVYRRAEHVIAVSGAIQCRLLRRDGVAPEKVTKIPNAVVTLPEEPGPLDPLPEELREGALAGVVARLQPEKGVDVFLEAASRVASLMPEARFAVIGDGPLRAELEGLTRRLDLEDKVSFLGHRPDARALMGMLDVIAVPSVTEGAPLVVLEAMAAAAPIVASHVGGIPDQVRDGEEALLVPPLDPDALAGAILHLLRDPSRARDLGEAARRRRLGVRPRRDGAPYRGGLPPRSAASSPTR
ncbi:MAG: glycosyltransferase family 4 protein [Actinomycetota bacterium]